MHHCSMCSVFTYTKTELLKHLIYSHRNAPNFIKEARAAITEELKKPRKEQDKALILKAQRATFQERRQFVADQGDGKIHEIIKEYPILGLASYIEKEFCLLKPNIAKKEVLMDRWSDLATSLDGMFALNHDSEEENKENEEILKLMRITEEKIKLQKRGSKKVMPGVVTVMDCKDVNLASSAKEPPRLILIRSEGRLTSAHIVGDRISIVVKKDVREALLTLLMAYYVWDLSYPKSFQLLGFLQTKLLQDQSPFHKGSGYMSLTRLLEENSR